MIKGSYMSKRSVEITLETAKKWFRKGGDLRELALSAFSKKELDDDEIEWDYDDLLKKFEDKYPIGSVVWSNDGTDNYPNVIVSKPYLKDADTGGYYRYNIKKHIVFDTKRILLDEVWDSHIEIRDKEEFDQIKIKSYNHPEGFNFEKWKESWIANNTGLINYWKGIIDSNEKQIVSLKKQISEYEFEIENFDELYNKCKKQIMSEIKKK